MSTTSSKQILFLTANPMTTTALKLDEEMRLISHRMRRAEYRKQFEFRSAPAIRATDLPYELMDNAPDIVHFSGHGQQDGSLLFVWDADRKTVPIPPATLARVFKQLQGRIQCVVLNACYSEAQAESIAKFIPCVVGMSRAVPDDAAIAFAAGFYEALAFGKSIAEAFELGQIQVELTSPELAGSADIMKLLVQSGVDASQLRIVSSAHLTLDAIEGESSVAIASSTQQIGSIEAAGTSNTVNVTQGKGGQGSQPNNSPRSQKVDRIQIDGANNQVKVTQN